MVAPGGDYEAHFAITHVNPDALPIATPDRNAADIIALLRVSGMTRQQCLAPMKPVFDKWSKDDAVAVTSDGYPFILPQLITQT